MASAGHLDKAWHTYAAAELPNDASTRQRLEVERAFFAGAAVVIERVADVGDSTRSAESKVALVTELKEIHEEIRQFAHAASAGLKG